MVKLRRYSFLWLLALMSFLTTGCEDGIQFPWSKDKAHEAEVTYDTAQTEADTISVEEPEDTTVNISEEDAEDYSGGSDAQWAETAAESGVKQWRVVVSSMPSEELAARFISRHNLDQARVVYVQRLDTYRVVYESFTELSDAQVEFKLIRSDFPDAWLVYF
jgi:hypothetical protein